MNINEVAIIEERRSKRDRRKQTASPFSYHRLLGRRQADRRGEDNLAVAQTIDIYPRYLIVITISILLLCAFDAHNTLLLLQLGAIELNPLMDVVLQQSSSIFVMSKFALTSLAMVILVPYYQERIFFNLISARHILFSSLFIYIVLISYQLSMFSAV
jgi:hypothetical protein